MTRRTLASRIAALYSRKLLPESWVVNPLSLISHSSLVSRGQSRRAATLLFSSPPPSALFPFSFFCFSSSFWTILVLGPVDYLYALADHRAPSEAARQWLRAIGGLPGTRPPIVHAWIGVYSCQGVASCVRWCVSTLARAASKGLHALTI